MVCLAVSIQYRRVTYEQTDRHLATAQSAQMHTHPAVKNESFLYLLWYRNTMLSLLLF